MKKKNKTTTTTPSVANSESTLPVTICRHLVSSSKINIEISNTSGSDLSGCTDFAVGIFPQLGHGPCKRELDPRAWREFVGVAERH